jgi:hypothetical protein
MVIFFPSIHPSLLSSYRNVSTSTAIPEAVLESRKLMPAALQRMYLWREGEARLSRRVFYSWFFLPSMYPQWVCHKKKALKNLFLEVANGRPAARSCYRRVLREGFPVAVSDFFDARAAVFIASWVKQYDKHRPFKVN